MENIAKGGGGTISVEQKRVLVEFLKKNPRLLSGKFSSDFTIKTGVAKWEELSNLLNSIPGAKKNWKNWRKVK